MLTADRLEEGRYLLGRLLEDILVVEPDTLLVGKTGTGLRTLGDVEQLDQLVKGEQLLLGAGVPA